MYQSFKHQISTIVDPDIKIYGKQDAVNLQEDEHIICRARISRSFEEVMNTPEPGSNPRVINCNNFPHFFVREPY